MAVSALGQLFRSIAPEKKPGEISISYSQFSMYSTCPFRWKLTYIDKIKFRKPSVHFVFGTAMHETLQYYLHTLFFKSAKEADQINLQECLQEQIAQNYMIAVTENGQEHFSTPAELQEFYEDGIAILEWFKRHRTEYFSNRTHELVAIEMPIYIQATDTHPTIMMNGFLDIVLRDIQDDRILIIDFKTSTKGWSKYEKQDKVKASQLVLYKNYIAKQYGYHEDKIDIQYLILKRKLIEGYAYPQKRVQLFVPASGKPTRNKLQIEIDKFISTAFNSDGTYNTTINYPAISNKGKNCKFCDFNSLEHLCPKDKRIK
jgi:hypothetical protein